MQQRIDGYNLRDAAPPAVPDAEPAPTEQQSTEVAYGLSPLTAIIAVAVALAGFCIRLF